MTLSFAVTRSLFLSISFVQLLVMLLPSVYRVVPGAVIALAQEEVTSAPSSDAPAPAADIPKDPDLLFQELADSDPAVQQTARDALRQMGESVVPMLIQGLGNPDDTLRQNALDVLTKLGPSASRPLIKALKDSDLRLRSGAAQALGMRRDRSAVPSLIRALNDSDPIMRQELFTALVAIGPPATGELINALGNPIRNIRRNAEAVLIKIGRPAVRQLISASGNKSETVRSTIIRTLGRIGDPEAIPEVLRGMSDASEDVRKQAVNAMIQFGPRAVNPLVTILKGVDLSRHEDAKSALIGIGKAVFPGLTALMQDNKAHFKGRAMGVTVLRQLGWKPRNQTELAWESIVMEEWDKVPIDPEAIPPLIATMGNIEEPMRMKASETIVRFGPLALTPLATGILREKNPLFLKGAAEALGNIGVRDFLAVETVTGLLKEKDPEVQFAAAEALGKIGNFLAVEPLLGVAEDETRKMAVRTAAVEALGKLGDPRVAVRLVAVTEKSSDPDFRESLIITLGLLRDPAAAPFLISLLGDPHPVLRKRAGEAIVLLRPPPISLLIEALEGSQPLIAQAASALLSQLGEPAADQLIQTLKRRDVSASIRAQAESLLIKLLETLPTNSQVMVKALEAPSDRVRLLAIKSLSRIKTAKSVPHLKAIVDQEWRYSKALRREAQSSLNSIQEHVRPEEWEGALEAYRLARWKAWAPVRSVAFWLLALTAGYWMLTALFGVGLSNILSGRNFTRPPYFKTLAQHLRRADPPLDPATVQRALRFWFSHRRYAVLPWMILTAGVMAAAVWVRIVDSILGTFVVSGGLLGLVFLVQSDYGVVRFSQLLSQRRRLQRFLLFPLTYLLLILSSFSSSTRSKRSSPSPSMIADSDIVSPDQILFKVFPDPEERAHLIETLTNQAEWFAQGNPQEILNPLYKEAEVRFQKEQQKEEPVEGENGGGEEGTGDVRAFLLLSPMAMALSEQREEIPEMLSKMLSLVHRSDPRVLQLLANEVLETVGSHALKGSLQIVPRLLRSGFYPTEKLVEEMKRISEPEQQMKLDEWKEMTIRINQGQFDFNDPIHVALHYTHFRRLADKSRILALLGHRPSASDYQRIIEKRQIDGPDVRQELILRDVANQLKQFISNLQGRTGDEPAGQGAVPSWSLVSSWLDHRLEEAFDTEDTPANRLFVVGTTGVRIAEPFAFLEEEIPADVAGLTPPIPK